MNTIIENAAVALVTAFVTWFFSRQKQRAETRASELENVEKAVSIWRSIAQDLEKKLDDVSSRCDALSKEIETLKIENKNLKNQLMKAIKNYNHENR